MVSANAVKQVGVCEMIQLDFRKNDYWTSAVGIKNG